MGAVLFYYFAFELQEEYGHGALSYFRNRGLLRKERHEKP